MLEDISSSRGSSHLQDFHLGFTCVRVSLGVHSCSHLRSHLRVTCVVTCKGHLQRVFAMENGNGHSRRAVAIGTRDGHLCSHSRSHLQQVLVTGNCDGHL